MKFIFFGTPYVARDTLAALNAADHVPVAVVTNPDAPQGRGQAFTPTPTNVWAQEHNIPVHTPEALDEAFIETLNAYDAQYAVVVAYGKIFPQALIDAFPKGAINVHYSLLPKYRGAAPVEHALLHGETETGVTVQHMAEKMDAGDILAQKAVAIEPIDTTATLRPKLIALGSELLIETLPAFEAGTLSPAPQDHAAATYAPKLKKEDAELDLSANAQTNWNKYRAYAEWSGVHFFKNGKRVKVTEAIRTADGAFQILKVVPEGKREMDYETFLRN